jgi:hypothetical protein
MSRTALHFRVAHDSRGSARFLDAAALRANTIFSSGQEIPVKRAMLEAHVMR